jgi:Ca2+-transporting ATPase
MLALLLAGGMIYLVLGDLAEALVLIVFASLSILITVIQENRTERVLEALRDLTSPRALVIRDGERVRIAGREVVRGDILVLSEGDRVAADAMVFDCHDLMADESLLTGESVPVHKQSSENALPGDIRPGGDGSPMVFSGSLVVRGSGLGEVRATGAASEIGKIGQTLSSLANEPPRLSRQVGRVVRIFAGIGGMISLLAVILYGLMRGNWLEGLLAGIALGMSMLPEEFPVVLTVFMAMGAWRISKARVLTRRAAAIETLGAATVLCTDKTGTLTENIMSIAEVVLPDGTRAAPLDAKSGSLPAEFSAPVHAGVLASARNPFDPMEKAFIRLGKAQIGSADLPAQDDGVLVREYGLRPDLLAVTQAWQFEGNGQDLVVASKGAPEAIAALCRLDEAQRTALKVEVDRMAVEGLRVLGVAEARTSQALPDDPHDFDFRFLGLVGLADRLRDSVPAAIAECRSAGIRVVMITGDYPATALAIAQSAGIETAGVMTGTDIAGLNDDDLASRLREVSVFARIMPEQKLRIVEALKRDGEVVAMTGDGVNDAPSIKAAHIGIAMGGRGTDVAREASSMVLLDDDFSSIVGAVKLGRRIYDNLVKAMGFILAVHVPIAGLALLPLVMDLPVIFGPMHIAFLEMIIDPVCSLVFEAEEDEKDLMERPPRAPDAPLFSWSLIGWSLAQGLVAFVLVAGLYLAAVDRGMPENEVRAAAFFATVFSIVGLIFVNRSFSSSIRRAIFRSNPMLFVVLAVVAILLAATLYWPFMSTLFGFGPLHGDDILITLSAGAGTLLFLEAIKRLFRLGRG